MYEDKASRAQKERDQVLISAGLRRPLKTGFCSAGHCEGSKPRSRDGKPLKTCPDYKVCPCQCHADLDEIFELSGKERVLVEHDAYEPTIGMHFEAATLIETPSVLTPEVEIPEDVLVSPAPGIVPGARVRVYNRTMTGRWARGQLEDYVKSVTDTWVIENERAYCTVIYIANNIAKQQGFAVPSAGGIDAVLKRWEEIGFATIERKPTRFTGYTAEAMEYGLDGVRDRYKRARRSNSMAF